MLFSEKKQNRISMLHSSHTATAQPQTRKRTTGTKGTRRQTMQLHCTHGREWDIQHSHTQSTHSTTQTARLHTRHTRWERHKHADGDYWSSTCTTQMVPICQRHTQAKGHTTSEEEGVSEHRNPTTNTADRVMRRRKLTQLPQLLQQKQRYIYPCHTHTHVKASKSEKETPRTTHR